MGTLCGLELGQSVWLHEESSCFLLLFNLLLVAESYVV